MKDNLKAGQMGLKWVVENIKQDGVTWRGFLASDILLMSIEDFYFFFPEKRIQEVRHQKLKELGI